jgi:tetrahydromethanopterin S-methyltransferase subunit E
LRENEVIRLTQYFLKSVAGFPMSAMLSGSVAPSNTWVFDLALLSSNTSEFDRPLLQTACAGYLYHPTWICTFTGGVMLDSNSFNHWYCWEMGVETPAQIGIPF